MYSSSVQSGPKSNVEESELLQLSAPGGRGCEDRRDVWRDRGLGRGLYELERLVIRLVHLRLVVCFVDRRGLLVGFG